VSKIVETPRMFPIQCGSPIPWAEAERAYRQYAKLHGTDQSMERLAQRGGFGVQEFSCLWLGHDPGRCQVEHLWPLDHVAALESENRRLREVLATVPPSFDVLGKATRNLEPLELFIPWKCQACGIEGMLSIDSYTRPISQIFHDANVSHRAAAKTCSYGNVGTLLIDLHIVLREVR